MRPGEFGIAEAELMFEDWRRRIITDKARKDAEEGNTPTVPVIDKSLSYYEQVLVWMEFVVYIDAYEKRHNRLDRIKSDG